MREGVCMCVRRAKARSRAEWLWTACRRRRQEDKQEEEDKQKKVGLQRERETKPCWVFFLSLYLKASPRSPHTVRTAGGMCIESNDHDSQTHTHTLGGNTSITKLLVERHICVCFLPHEFRAWLTPPGGTGKSHFFFLFFFFFFLLFHPCD